MNEASDVSPGGWAHTAVTHVRRHWRLYGGIGLATAGLVFFAGVLGFRGLGPPAVAIGEAAGELVDASRGNLRTPHPFLELFAGWLGTGLGLSALSTLQFLGLISVASAVPAVAGIAKKLGGPWAAASAAVVFAALPAVAGAATTIGTGAIFLGMWAWFLRLLVVERHHWHDTIALWVLGGALILTWAPFALWGALWIYLEMREAEFSTAHSQNLAGEYDVSAIPVAILLAPVGVFAVATLLHPALLHAPIEGWKAFGDHALRWSGSGFTYAGEAYVDRRPPLWSGFALLWWTVPALTLLSGAAGWLHLAVSRWRGTRAARLAQQMCLWGLPLLACLPWLNRGPAWGELHFVAILAPILAVAAGVAIARGLRAVSALAEARGGERAGRFAPRIGAALVGGLLVATALRAHPVEGSYYSPVAGGFAAAVEKGLTVSRDGVYPVDTIRRARDRAEADSLAVLGESNLVEKYVRLGLLEGVRPVDAPGGADARIRRIDRFEPDGDSVLKNPQSLVDLSRDAVPLLEVDGVPIYWMEGAK